MEENLPEINETPEVTKIKVEIINNIVRIDRDVSLTQGSFNSLKLIFEFPKEWESLTKVAVFEKDGNIYKEEIFNNECNIPFDALKVGLIKIGVYGLIGNLLIISPIPDILEIKDGSYTDEEPIGFELSNYDKWVVEADKIYKNILNLKDDIIKNSTQDTINYFKDNNDFITETKLEETIGNINEILDYINGDN